MKRILIFVVLAVTMLLCCSCSVLDTESSDITDRFQVSFVTSNQSRAFYVIHDLETGRSFLYEPKSGVFEEITMGDVYETLPPTP